MINLLFVEAEGAFPSILFGYTGSETQSTHEECGRQGKGLLHGVYDPGLGYFPCLHNSFFKELNKL